MFNENIHAYLYKRENFHKRKGVPMLSSRLIHIAAHTYSIEAYCCYTSFCVFEVY